MLNHAIKLKFAGATAILLALAIVSILGIAELSHAQETSLDMQTLLEQLNDQGVSIYIRFITPIAEDVPSWTIPSMIEHENEIAIRRSIREIGSDYICVNEIGETVWEVDCVPFSNIAYINYQTAE